VFEISKEMNNNYLFGLSRYGSFERMVDCLIPSLTK